MYRNLRPPVIQISGGEPLLRKDVEDIIKAVKQPNGTPYIVFVTNGALLTVERFNRLREIGVDAYSISLDYPDERHDDFRSIPGLFGRIRDLARGVDDSGRSIITLNSVIQSDNFRDLPRMAEVAREWGVSINYSPYTWLRTHDMSFVISGDDLPEYADITEQLIAYKKRYGVIRTTDSFLRDMVAFFRDKSRPGCRAGERFLVVNPDATLSPCGLIMGNYASREELIEGFTRSNTCTACNTCIRASTEHPLNSLLTGALQTLRG
jgi:MoaA/NifB/PqqE/SkfB family radical SAM enzyme